MLPVITTLILREPWHVIFNLSICGGLILAGQQVPTITTLSLPSSLGRGEKIKLKACGLKQGHGGITHQLLS